MKALYLESSAVVAWLFGEDSAGCVVRAMNQAEVRVTSALTVVEVERAIQRAVAARIVREAMAHKLRGALEREGVPVKIEGLSAWTDAAPLNEAGIPTICFGPGDIALAHAAEEFVPIEEIDVATRVLTRVVREWCEDSVPTI